jgi:phosphoribosylformylglycinamidine synthase
VPLKDRGLQPWEIWLSESQERMVLAVAPEQVPAIMEVAAKHGAPCADLGHFGADGVLRVLFGGASVIELPVSFLHGGQPRAELVSRAFVDGPKPVFDQGVEDATMRIERFLASHAGRSRRPVVRRYDTLVQGGTLLAPLQGVAAVGPGDGAVARPLELQADGGAAPAVVVGVGMCPEWTAIDAAVMGWRAVCEALANVVAAGADPAWTALLDNFAWGDPARPEELGSLVRAVEGCCAASETFGTPFISGKDSLRNHWVGPDGERRVVPGTLVVTAVGRLPPGVKPVGTAFREAGECVWVIGTATMPRTRAPFALVHAAIAAGLVTACHDISDGGLAAALAEMGFVRGLGADVALASWVEAAVVDEAIHDDTPGRFVCTCKESDAGALAALFVNVKAVQVGRVTADGRLAIRHGDRLLLDADVTALRAIHLGEDARG